MFTISREVFTKARNVTTDGEEPTNVASGGASILRASRDYYSSSRFCQKTWDKTDPAREDGHEVRSSHTRSKCCTTYHVVKVLVVWFLESANWEGDLVDPLLSAALEPQDFVAVVYAGALASAPELRLRRVDLLETKYNNKITPVEPLTGVSTDR